MEKIRTSIIIPKDVYDSILEWSVKFRQLHGVELPVSQAVIALCKIGLNCDKK